ncbi:uncharacterized protein GGS25DRAFT_527468 [Hypoxylon fragiforme]|uniref:uncharacterized protein n=1 Tax=Hypoxylon fragiforme TaxID=63214 RepID=UPI0020C705C1|nr:uncharacterized protein GGS25DRAFT_527468 [Hypoxylon fragiforme]KAI2614337.1 hypothetical protein GGS25DRAFT_527468 [Hypoxylon fragiforme]
MLKPIIPGVAFGAALAAAGIHQPTVIVEQMSFQNWHMITTFLTAAGASTILVNIFQRLGYIHLNPRAFSTIGIFGPFDGNIIGGCLLGAGMTISDSCPGTLFAQVGAGMRSGLYSMIGGILGGVLWSGLLRPTLRSQATGKPMDTRDDRLTLDRWTGISKQRVLIVLESTFASVIAATVYFTSPKSNGLVGPVVGGLMIAGAQLTSILIRKSLLGTSSSFEEVGDYVWWAIGQGVRPKSYSTIVFTAGMIFGALVIFLAFPSAPVAPEVVIKPTRSLLGGILIAIGSRMAGGCTSGHGISGISLLSISSLITVASMFAGGAGVTAVIG